MFKSKSRARQTSVLSRSLRYGAPVAAATALVFGFGGSAWADSEVGFVTQQTATGGCTAGLDVTSLTKSAPAYAYGTFYNFTAGYTCYAWLERSTDGGSSWYEVSGTHTLTDPGYTTSASTDHYYDGPGYLARACFKYSWSTAATHCTASW